MLNVALQVAVPPEISRIPQVGPGADMAHPEELPDGELVEVHFTLTDGSLDLLMPWDAFRRMVARAGVILAEHEAER